MVTQTTSTLEMFKVSDERLKTTLVGLYQDGVGGLVVNGPHVRAGVCGQEGVVGRRLAPGPETEHITASFSRI